MRRALALALLLATPVANAADDSSPAPPDPALVADARSRLDTVHDYVIEGGSLLDAVAAIAEISGVRIVFAPATRELESRTLEAPIAGALATAAALDRALGVTDLLWRLDEYGTVRIERGDGKAEVALETLTIEDSALSAEGGQPRDATRAGLPRFSVEGRGPSSTVLQGPTLGAQVVNTFDDLLRRAPNVSGRGSALSIRGIQRGDESAITASVYLDGIPLGGRALDFGLFGFDRLARVEYQRGPRSLWEGVGALAGTIRLDSDEPSPEAGATVGVEADHEGAARARVSANGSLMPGLAARAAFERRAEPGFIENVFREESGNDRSYESSGNFKLMYEPDALEALTVRLTGFAVSGDPGQPRLIPRNNIPFDPADRLTYSAEEVVNRVEVDGARLEAGWRFDDRTALAAAALYSDTTEFTERSLDLDGPRRNEEDDEERRSESELRLTHAFDSKWTVIASVTDAKRSVAVQSRAVATVESELPTGSVRDVTPESYRVRSVLVDTVIDSESALVELERRGKYWDFAVGVRHLSEEKRQLLRNEDYLTVPDCRITLVTGQVLDCLSQFPGSITDRERTGDEPVNVPRFLARLRPNEDHTLALTYREGYLGGGARLNVFTGALIDFQAERSESLDFAWDATLADWLELRTTLFYNRWRDRQVRVDQPQGGGAIIVNAAKARAWGGEIEARGSIGDAWSWWLGYGGLRTRYDRFPYAVPGGSIELEGNVFPGAPERTVTAGVAWSGPKGWYASINAWHSSEAYSDARNLELGLREAYEVVDLKAGRRFGPWHLYGYVTNALDETYVEDVRLGEITPSARDYLVGRPRQIGLGVEIEF